MHKKIKENNQNKPGGQENLFLEQRGAGIYSGTGCSKEVAKRQPLSKRQPVDSIKTFHTKLDLGKKGPIELITSKALIVKNSSAFLSSCPGKRLEHSSNVTKRSQWSGSPKTEPSLRTPQLVAGENKKTLKSKKGSIHSSEGAGQRGRETKKQGFIKIRALPKNRNLFCLIGINRTKNNTHAIISNLFGENKTRWSISAGQFKIPGGRRKTRLSQRMIYKSCLEKALSFGYRFAIIHCKGTRGSKVRIFRFFGGSRSKPTATALTVLLVKDTTGAAHNGCRPPKIRRV